MPPNRQEGSGSGSVSERIRLIAAVILLCALCLPLSRCKSSNPAKPPPSHSLTQILFPHDDSEFSYRYALTSSDKLPFSVIGLIAFAWPAILIASTRKTPVRFHWILRTVELLLCAGSVWWLYEITIGMLADPLYGAFVAAAALLAYAVVTIVALICMARASLARRRNHLAPEAAI